MLIAQTHAHTHILGLIGKIPISHREAFSVSEILQLCPNMCVTKEGFNYLHVVFMVKSSPILITVECWVMFLWWKDIRLTVKIAICQSGIFPGCFCWPKWLCRPPLPSAKPIYNHIAIFNVHDSCFQYTIYFIGKCCKLVWAQITFRSVTTFDAMSRRGSENPSFYSPARHFSPTASKPRRGRYGSSHEDEEETGGTADSAVGAATSPILERFATSEPRRGSLNTYNRPPCSSGIAIPINSQGGDIIIGESHSSTLSQPQFYG